MVPIGLRDVLVRQFEIFSDLIYEGESRNGRELAICVCSTVRGRELKGLATANPL